MAGAVRAERLCKVYAETHGLRDVARALLGMRPAPGPARAAVDGVDIDLGRGESLGVVGRNGSGKTTLLRLLTGALPPTSGHVHVQGRVAALIDLAAGIDPRFSGRENALLLMMLAGRGRAEARAALPEVRAFSGLGDAFEAPVQRYSTGMTLRLAFSAIMASDPDVLLVDEVLAVGDAFFQQRCLLRVRQLQDRGTTVVLVSHDPSAILGFCDRAMWLEHGRVACSGEPAKVVREYTAAHYRDPGSLEATLEDGLPTLVPGADGAPEPASRLPNVDARHGDARARITGIALRDDRGRALAAPTPGAPVRVAITLLARGRVGSPVVGFSLRNRIGDIVAATNTAHVGHALPPLEAGQRLHVEFRLPWPAFASGAFSLSPAVADGTLDAHVMNDWVDNALVTEVHNPDARYGWIALAGASVRCAIDDAPDAADEGPGDDANGAPTARAPGGETRR